VYVIDWALGSSRRRGRGAGTGQLAQSARRQLGCGRTPKSRKALESVGLRAFALLACVVLLHCSALHRYIGLASWLSRYDSSPAASWLPPLPPRPPRPRPSEQPATRPRSMWPARRPPPFSSRACWGLCGSRRLAAQNKEGLRLLHCCCWHHLRQQPGSMLPRFACFLASSLLLRPPGARRAMHASEPMSLRSHALSLSQAKERSIQAPLIAHTQGGSGSFTPVHTKQALHLQT
jgi:hypothetical protein